MRAHCRSTYRASRHRNGDCAVWVVGLVIVVLGLVVLGNSEAREKELRQRLLPRPDIRCRVESFAFLPGYYLHVSNHADELIEDVVVIYEELGGSKRRIHFGHLSPNEHQVLDPSVLDEPFTITVGERFWIESKGRESCYFETNDLIHNEKNR